MSAQELITQHLDIWTAAHKTRSTAGRGSNNKLDLVGIKKLRELILELAVRGKLVPQDANDEPASELLKKIAAEKAKLIKEGKIKKEKFDVDSSENDELFEIPNGWEWVRLGNVINFINGYAFKSSDFSDKGVGIVKIGDIQNGVLTPETMSRVDPSVLANIDDSLRVENGDLLIAMSGATTGKLGFNTTEEYFYLNQRVGKICPYLIDPKYLYFPLTTKIAENLEKSLGSAIPNLSTAQINDIVFALPPLQEQHRIVAKVDELMAFCDQLEQTQSDNIAAHAQLVEALLATLTQSPIRGELVEPHPSTLRQAQGERSSGQTEFAENWQRIAAHFDTLFTTEHSIDQLKQTILQLAVMGKLVPQDPNDEPASELLKKIAAEKAQLIKEGKIKKEKPLPEITEEEKPFELPSAWEWARIGNAALSTDYGISDKSSENEIGVPVFAMGHIQSGKVILGFNKFVSPNIDALPDSYLKNRDLLYNRTNSAELVGKTGIYRGNDDQYTFASYLIRIRTAKDSFLPEFLNLNMLSPQFRLTQIDPHLKQQCGQANVNGTIMKSMLVAIAPQSEIERIILKVDELMSLCDTLKTNLQNAQATQLALADALVEQAVN